MSVVMRLAQAERVKLTSTPMLGRLVAGALVVALVGTLLGTVADLTEADLASAAGRAEALTTAGLAAAVFALCLGVAAMTGEERSGTLDQLLAAAPARWPVVGAKALACAVAGAGLGLATGLLSLVTAAIVLAVRDVGFDVLSAFGLQVVLGAVMAGAAFGALGVALGALFRDQGWATAVGLGWLLLVDRAALAWATPVGRLLPTGGLEAVTRSDSPQLLSPQGGAVLLLGWVAVLLLVAAVALRRRDVG